VKNANWSLGTPILVNSITEMLFTKKYGIPSVKYNDGTHTHGDMLLLFLIYYTRVRDYWKLARLSVTSAFSSMSCIAWYGR
jgi:hypothetical protein